MKKIVMFLLFFVCILSASARADFFDSSDGKWWMDESQWMDIDFDPAGTLSVADTNNRLEFSSEFNPGEGFIAKASNWTLNLDHDFDLSVRMHFSHTGMLAEGYADLELAFLSSDFDPSLDENPRYLTYFTSENRIGYDSEEGRSESVPIYGVYEEFSEGEGRDEAFYRPAVESDFFVHYDSTEDTLALSIAISDSISFDREIDDFREKLGTDTARVALGVWVERSAFTGSEVNFSNLDIAGTMAPEPISSLLFLLGGGAMALIRRRKTT